MLIGVNGERGIINAVHRYQQQIIITEKKKIKNTAIQTSHWSRVVNGIRLIKFIFKSTKVFGFG